jgi:hypothetical protein
MILVATVELGLESTHPMGMDHESDGGGMARAEKRWRARLGLPGGLIERVTA